VNCLLSSDPLSSYKSLWCSYLLSDISEIPQVILLTKVDKLDEKIAQDASSIFSSWKAERMVQKLSKTFGLPENHVLPVKNYNKEIMLDVGVDILALMALRQMLYFSEDHLENIQMMKARSSSRTKCGKSVQGKRAADQESA